MHDLDSQSRNSENGNRRKYRKQPCPVCTCPIDDMQEPLTQYAKIVGLKIPAVNGNS